MREIDYTQSPRHQKNVVALWRYPTGTQLIFYDRFNTDANSFFLLRKPFHLRRNKTSLKHRCFVLTDEEVNTMIIPRII